MKKNKLPYRTFNDIALSLVQCAEGMPARKDGGVCCNVTYSYIGYVQQIQDILPVWCADWPKSVSEKYPIGGMDEYINKAGRWKGESLQLRRELSTYMLTRFLDEFEGYAESLS